MSWSNSVELTIAAPRETIFTYLLDFTRHSEWSASVQEIKLISGEAGKVGAEYEAHENIPRPLVSFARITALDPPRLIAWESTDHRVFRTNWEIDLEALADSSTRVIQRVTFHPLTPLATVLLYLIRVPRVAPENRSSLQRIKHILETHPPMQDAR